MSQDDDVPPLDPKRVVVFVLLLGMIAFAGWRYWQARAAVAAVAEASKDYRKLFPARSSEAPAPPPKPVLSTEAPVSGIGMLKIDDDMRAPKPAPPSAEPPAALPQAPPQAEAPPVAIEKAVAAAPVKPVSKTFSRPRLNSGAFSGLNGGSGIGFSGTATSGGGGGGSAAPKVPAIPGMPAVPATTDKK
jgi:hypothetical protein